MKVNYSAKKALYRFWAIIVLMIATIAGFYSCNNDFLNENQVVTNEMYDTIYISNLSQPFNVTVQLPTSGNDEYQIVQLPQFIDISPLQGTLNNGSVMLHFDLKEEKIPVGTGSYIMPLTFEVAQLGLISYNLVFYNLGNPTIEASPSAFYLENNKSGSFELVNHGDGILVWEIAGKPGWLEISKDNGVLESHFMETVSFTVDHSDLSPGDYTGSIQIISNATNGTYYIQVNIKVPNAVTSGEIANPGEGEFIDAIFSRTRDEVMVLTKNPNQVLFFSPLAEVPDTLKLNRVPRCFNLSENENKFAIGFTNTEISIYDAVSHAETNTFSTSSIPISVEIGNAGWAYFLAEFNYGINVYSLNLGTGEIIRAKNGSSGLKSLTKVPGRNMLISTRPGYSPDGLFVFDIENGVAADTLNEYWLGAEGIWLSENGDKIITGNKKIYHTPAYVSGQTWSMDPPALAGEMEFPNVSLTSAAHQQSTDRLFVATGGYWHTSPTNIYQLDGSNLTITKTFVIDPARPAEFPMGTTWGVKVSYLFPSPDEEHLWLMQRFPNEQYDVPDDWAIARISLN
jgi:hypothetical protein